MDLSLNETFKFFNNCNKVILSTIKSNAITDMEDMTSEEKHEFLKDKELIEFKAGRLTMAYEQHIDRPKVYKYIYGYSNVTPNNNFTLLFDDDLKKGLLNPNAVIIDETEN